MEVAWYILIFLGVGNCSVYLQLILLPSAVLVVHGGKARHENI